MKDEKETRRKLLDSGYREFSEKGYMKASLRNICKNAGVTTGALYFFFRDKEDLFSSIVNEPLQNVFRIMMEHFRWEKNQISEEQNLPSKSAGYEDFFQDHIKSYHQVIHELYRSREIFLLLLTKAQGSSFENAVDNFINIAEGHLRILADQICNQMKLPRVENQMIHWVGHLQIEIFVYMLTHVETEEEAIKYTDITIKYMISGWNAMFQPV